MKKNNTWIKVVIIIIILELVVGGFIFAYRKLNSNDNSISTDDKVVKDLYEKVAYNDIESLDVMNTRTMLYYGYKNTDNIDTIDCDTVNVMDDTTGYTCEDETDFIKRSDIEDTIKDIYGPDTNIENISFETDANHYAFFDAINDGYAIYTKEEEVSVDPVNMNLKNATLDDDGNIIITVEVLNGVFGTVEDTYDFTFTKDKDNYYLTKKEVVANKED